MGNLTTSSTTSIINTAKQNVNNRELGNLEKQSTSMLKGEQDQPFEKRKKQKKEKNKDYFKSNTII